MIVRFFPLKLKKLLSAIKVMKGNYLYIIHLILKNLSFLQFQASSSHFRLKIQYICIIFATFSRFAFEILHNGRNKIYALFGSVKNSSHDECFVVVLGFIAVINFFSFHR